MFKNDLGTTFRATIKDKGRALPIPGGAVVTFYFEKPNGQVISRVGALTNGGGDGRTHYVTVAGDLDHTGVWKWQVKVSFDASHAWRTNIKSFDVLDILE